MFSMPKMDYLIAQNIRRHDIISHKYEKIHSEIFNPIEQEKLRSHLEEAASHIRTSSKSRTALDYGCGTGNITRHLIDMGIRVVSADVSRKFLSIVKNRYSGTGLCETIRINGKDLSVFENSSFDFTAIYSVLHHIPDYLQIVKDLVRITKPGGIIYIDHEENENYWNRDPKYVEFLRAALPGIFRKSWKRFFKFSTYANRLRGMIRPYYTSEGDVHTRPDDHVEWAGIESILTAEHCEIVFKRDYLSYRANYPEDIYYKFKDLCSDYRVLAARKTCC